MFRHFGREIIKQATIPTTTEIGRRYRDRQRLPWSPDKIYGTSDRAAGVAADTAQEEFVKGLRRNQRRVSQEIKGANEQFIDNRNSGVSPKEAEENRRAELEKADDTYRQETHNTAIEAKTSGGVRRDVAAVIGGDRALWLVNKLTADAAEKKVIERHQELEKLETESTALDAKEAADLKALVRTDAEITATIQQDAHTTKAGVIYERFEQIQQGMQKDKDVQLKVALAATNKYEELGRTKNIINDRSVRTNEERRDRLENDFKSIFSAAFSKDAKAPTPIEEVDIANALKHDSVQDALTEANKDVPGDTLGRQVRTARVKNAIQAALSAGISEKMMREEATRRFLKGTEGSFVAHGIVQKIEAANPSSNGATRLAAARASNIHELHNLKAVDISGKDQINTFQEKHKLQRTDAPDADHVQQHIDAQKAPADMQAQYINDLKNGKTALATFADVHENRAKPETQEITNYERASAQIDVHYNVEIEQAQQTSETAIDTARRTRNKEITDANKQHTRELETISKDGSLSDSEKVEKGKKAKDKFIEKTIAEIDERCKSAEIDARKKHADLIIERDTAKAELDRIYPLAAVRYKIAEIKRLKKDIQTTINKKSENDAQRKELQSQIEAFQARKLAKDTNWYAEREKAWYDYLKQVRKTNEAEAEYEVAHAESDHYERLWKKSSAEFDNIQKGITLNNDKVHYIREEQDQLREQQNQLREELKTPSASTDADAIAAAIQAKTDAIQAKTDDIAAIETQTKGLIVREAVALSDITKYQDEFHKHEEISKQKKQALTHEKKVHATKDTEYKLINERAESDGKREDRHADRLREKEKLQETFQMLRMIQSSNNRAMILSQALGQSSSAINAHAIGGLQAMLAALQK
ncbi:hypothetical protein ccbrp13_05480 [Ktedonobacteria bacterium brp13]|nr:hypothetical protein ccbrp13_05480 [Ktedonobacteria bacterium brp13]